MATFTLRLCLLLSAVVLGALGRAQDVRSCVFRWPGGAVAERLATREMLVLLQELVEPPLRHGTHSLVPRGPYLYGRVTAAQQRWIAAFLQANRAAAAIEVELKVAIGASVPSDLTAAQVDRLRQLDGRGRLTPAMVLRRTALVAASIRLADAVRVGADGRVVLEPRTATRDVGGTLAVVLLHLPDGRKHLRSVLGLHDLPPAGSRLPADLVQVERRVGSATFAGDTVAIDLGRGILLTANLVAAAAAGAAVRR